MTSNLNLGTLGIAIETADGEAQAATFTLPDGSVVTRPFPATGELNMSLGLGLGLSAQDAGTGGGGGGELPFSDVEVLAGLDGAHSQTSFTDESDNAHSFTFLGGAALNTAAKKFGTASLFVGGNGARITIADHASLELGADPWTLEGWFYWSQDLATFQDMIGKWDSAGNQRPYLISYDGPNNQLKLFLSANGTSAGTILTGDTWSPTLNTWYHIRADFDGTTYRLYRDGVMIASSTSTLTLFNGSAPFAVGGQTTTSLTFRGHIDEVRLARAAPYASDDGFTVPTAPFPRS